MKEKEHVLDLLDAYFDSELNFKEQSLVTRRIIEGDAEVIQKLEALRLIRSELNIWSQKNNSTKTNFWEKIERDICKIASQQSKRNIFERIIEDSLEEIKYFISRPIPLGFAATAALFVFALTHSFHSFYDTKRIEMLAADNNPKPGIEDITLVSTSNQLAENNSQTNQLILKNASASEEKLDNDDFSNETLFKNHLSINLLSAADTFNNKELIHDLIEERNPLRFALINNQKPLKLNLGQENHNQLQTEYKLVNFK